MKKAELRSEIKLIKWLDGQGVKNKEIARIINTRRKAIKQIKNKVKRGVQNG